MHILRHMGSAALAIRHRPNLNTGISPAAERPVGAVTERRVFQESLAALAVAMRSPFGSDSCAETQTTVYGICRTFPFSPAVTFGGIPIFFVTRTRLRAISAPRVPECRPIGPAAAEPRSRRRLWPAFRR